MRALLTVLGIIAVVLIIVGFLLEALRWLLIVGFVALLAALVISAVQGRRAANRL